MADKDKNSDDSTEEIKVNVKQKTPIGVSFEDASDEKDEKTDVSSSGSNSKRVIQPLDTSENTSDITEIEELSKEKSSVTTAEEPKLDSITDSKEDEDNSESDDKKTESSTREATKDPDLTSKEQQVDTKEELTGIRPVPDDLNPDAKTPGNKAGKQEEATMSAPVPVTNKYNVKNHFKKPKGFGVGKKIATAVAVLVLLLGVGYGAFAYFQMQQPENKIKRAVANTLTSESSQYELSIASSDTEAGDFENATLTATGSVIADDAVSFEGALVVDEKVDVDFAIRYVSDSLYFKFANVAQAIANYKEELSPDDEFAEYTQIIATIFGQFDDVWIEVASSELDNVVGETVDSRTEAEIEADNQKLAEIFADSELFTIQSELGQKQIKDNTAEGYLLSFSVDGFNALLDDIEQAEFNSVDNEQIKQIRTSLQELESQVESLDTNATQRFELWIADGFIAEVIFSATDTTSEFELSLVLFNYGNAVPVNVPAETIPFEEFAQAVFGALFGVEAEVLSSAQEDTERRADVAKIAVAMEEYAANNNGVYTDDVAILKALTEDSLTYPDFFTNDPDSIYKVELVSEREYVVSAVLTDGAIYEIES